MHIHVHTEWPPVVVDASKSGSEFQKRLDEAALAVKTSYWCVNACGLNIVL